MPLLDRNFRKAPYEHSRALYQKLARIGERVT